MIWPRSAILHSAAASIVDGTLGLTVSMALRIATRTSVDAHGACARSIAFCTMSTLSSSVGRDVHRGIGDDQRVGWPGTSMTKQWLMRRAVRMPGLARDHGAHQLVGVQAALHQGFGPALP